MTQTQPRPTDRDEQRSRIVGAAARLLADHGQQAVTTRAVADAAGVQAPTIYRLFGDKDGLLDAVAEHQLAQYVTAKSQVSDTDDPVADLRVAWDRHIGFGLDNPALATLLADPVRAARSPAVAAGQRVLVERVHRVAVAGRLRVPEPRAVDLIHAAGTGAVLTLLAEPVDRRDPALADTIFEAVLTAVLTDTSAPAASTTTSAAVSLRASLPELGLTAGEQMLMGEWLDRIAGGQRPSGVRHRHEH